MTHFLAWAAVTIALLGVALAFSLFLDWLGTAAERRDARLRNQARRLR